MEESLEHKTGYIKSPDTTKPDTAEVDETSVIGATKGPAEDEKTELWRGDAGATEAEISDDAKKSQEKRIREEARLSADQSTNNAEALTENAAQEILAQTNGSTIESSEINDSVFKDGDGESVMVAEKPQVKTVELDPDLRDAAESQLAAELEPEEAQPEIVEKQPESKIESEPMVAEVAEQTEVEPAVDESDFEKTLKHLDEVTSTINEKIATLSQKLSEAEKVAEASKEEGESLITQGKKLIADSESRFQKEANSLNQQLTEADANKKNILNIKSKTEGLQSQIESLSTEDPTIEDLAA